MKRLLTLALLTMLTTPPLADAHMMRKPVWRCHHKPTVAARRACVIYDSFKMHDAGHEAVRVARCESGPRFDINARNGQYLGVFQMGRAERARYGHAQRIVGQVQAARRYYRVAKRIGWGNGWGPWSCKP